MKINNNRLKSLKKVENRINRNLFLICSAVTLIVMAMVLAEFFTCGFFSTIRIEFFYLGVLIIYSLHKEMVRWLGEKRVERQGEHFVYVWVGLTTALYVLNFLTKGHLFYLPNCDTTAVLKNATLISLEVLAIFIFTRFLKLLKFFLKK